MPIKIFLGNIAESTVDHELRPMFEKYGEVTECDVVANFGFVHMQNESEAKVAIDAINGTIINGKALSVELSKKPARGGRGGFDRGRGGGRGDMYGGRGGDRDGGGKMGFDRGGRGRGSGRGRGGPPGGGRGWYEENYAPRRDAYGERDRYPPPPPRERYDPYSRAAYDRYEDYYRSRAYADAYERERRPYDRYSPPPYERRPYPPPPRRDSPPPPPPRDPYARPPPEYYDRSRSHYDSPAYSRRDAPSERSGESEARRPEADPRYPEDRRRDYISGPPPRDYASADRLPPSGSAYERADYSRTEAKSADPYGRYGSAPSKLPPASGAYGNSVSAPQDPYSSGRDPYASVASRDPYATSRSRDPHATSAPRDPYATPTSRDPYASPASVDPYGSTAYASAAPSSSRQLLASAPTSAMPSQSYLQKAPAFF